MANFVNAGFETNLSNWIAGKKPSEISGVLAWYDPSQESYSNDDAVGSLTDRSGNGLTMTQDTAGEKPTFKTNIVNGEPILRANADKWLNNATGLGLTGDSSYDFFAVAATSDNTVLNVLFGAENSANNERIYIGFDSSGQLNNSAFSQNWASHNGSVSNNTFYVLDFDYNSTASERHTYLSGNKATQSGAPDRASNAGQFQLFTYGIDASGNAFKGDAGELMAFNAVLSDQNKAYITSRLALKYGITLSGYGANITRDTGTKYAGSASMKVVSAAANCLTPVYELVNPGTTGSYTLTGYAYTSGAEVTSADVELYYDGATVTTTFTDMTGGWYKMTATVTGAVADKKCGAEVKTNKTVYLDGFDLSVEAAVATSSPNYIKHLLNMSKIRRIS